MKISVLNRSLILNQEDPSKVHALFFFELFEYENSKDNLGKVLEEMGFDDEFKKEYGTDEIPKSIESAIDNSSFSVHSISRLLKPISDVMSSAHVALPDASISSTSKAGLVPYFDGMVIGEWIGVSKNDLEALKSLEEKITIHGFKGALKEREEKECSILEAFLDEKFSMVISQAPEGPVLEISDWNFRKLGNVNIQEINKLNLFFENYVNRVSSSNYRLTQKSCYKTEMARLVSRKGLRGQDLKDSLGIF